jgi:hypothetical protein
MCNNGDAELYEGIYGSAQSVGVHESVRRDKERTMEMPFNAPATLLAE